MSQPTSQQPTDQTLDALIDEAFAAKQILPHHERAIELDRLLREAIVDRLLPAVVKLAERAPERSRDWYHFRDLLDDTRETLADTLGSGLVSAAIQLDRLAQACEKLRAESAIY